ncbi:MAG: exodeoxyribonuclease large subunit, partial [Solirubrobacteraceae bacterium]|nr:exodeoxyribonuclease large subunit [Solirubrobacteraceae bacterium]
MAEAAPRPTGIEGSRLAGPFPVGAYAAKLREELAKRARLQLFGEVWTVRISPRGAKVFFVLRDADGALPCS